MDEKKTSPFIIIIILIIVTIVTASGFVFVRKFIFQNDQLDIEKLDENIVINPVDQDGIGN